MPGRCTYMYSQDNKHKSHSKLAPPTFQFVGDPVLHLDVDEQHGEGDGVVVPGPQGDVPEAWPDGVDREETLPDQFFIVVEYGNTEHG